jgi:hypothetical protein
MTHPTPEEKKVNSDGFHYKTDPNKWDIGCTKDRYIAPEEHEGHLVTMDGADCYCQDCKIAIPNAVSTPKGSWEERFDSKFPIEIQTTLHDGNFESDYKMVSLSEIKSFIREEIKQAEERKILDVIKLIHAQKQECIDGSQPGRAYEMQLLLERVMAL